MFAAVVMIKMAAPLLVFLVMLASTVSVGVGVGVMEGGMEDDGDGVDDISGVMDVSTGATVDATETGED